MIPLYFAGKEVKRVSQQIFRDLTASGSRAFCVNWHTPDIDVYDVTTWERLHTFKAPCRDQIRVHHVCIQGKHCERFVHTIHATERLLYLCCSNTHKLYILDTQGKLLCTEGPNMHVVENTYSQEKTNCASATGRLRGPRLGQYDDQGGLLLVDSLNKRLLFRCRGGEGRDVTPPGLSSVPLDVVWCKDKLFVLNSDDLDTCEDKITMFT